MKYSNYYAFQRDCKANGIEYAAKHSAALGFDAVEFLDVLMSPSPQYESLDASYVKSVLEQNGLTVACFSVVVNLLTTDFAILKERFAKQIEFAARLGAPCLHHPLVPGLSMAEDAPSYASVFDRILEPAVWIAERCAEYGLTCLYEPQGMYFNGVEGLKPFYQCVSKACSNVAICGDVGNALFVDVSANEIYDAFLHDIKHVHVKDYLIGDRAIEERCWQSRGGKWISECPIGTGVTDFSYCFNRLKQVGYDASISFELDGDDKTLTDALQKVKSWWQC